MHACMNECESGGGEREKQMWKKKKKVGKYTGYIITITAFR